MLLLLLLLLLLLEGGRGGAADSETLIVVVDTHGQGDFDTGLSNDVLVKALENLFWCQKTECSWGSVLLLRRHVGIRCWCPDGAAAVAAAAAAAAAVLRHEWVVWGTGRIGATWGGRPRLGSREKGPTGMAGWRAGGRRRRRGGGGGGDFLVLQHRILVVVL